MIAEIGNVLLVTVAFIAFFAFIIMEIVWTATATNYNDGGDGIGYIFSFFIYLGFLVAMSNENYPWLPPPERNPIIEWEILIVSSFPFVAFGIAIVGVMGTGLIYPIVQTIRERKVNAVFLSWIVIIPIILFSYGKWLGV